MEYPQNYEMELPSNIKGHFENAPKYAQHLAGLISGIYKSYVFEHSPKGIIGFNSQVSPVTIYLVPEEGLNPLGFGINWLYGKEVILPEFLDENGKYLGKINGASDTLEIADIEDMMADEELTKEFLELFKTFRRPWENVEGFLEPSLEEITTDMYFCLEMVITKNYNFSQNNNK